MAELRPFHGVRYNLATIPEGMAAVLAWKGNAVPAAQALTAQMQQLRTWAEQQGLQLDREEHSRVLALMDQPQLAVLVDAPAAVRPVA